MSAPSADGAFVFNGIDATSGRYLLPPLSPAALTAIARGQVTDESHAKELQWRHHRASEDTLAPREGVDPKNLAETGWGAIFAHGGDPSVREALKQLLDLRRGQASSVSEGRYREFTGPDAYRPGESKQQFLARHGAGPGPVDPDVVPYYLLIVGDPTAIPFEFQYRLDVQYAVGRIHFDRLEDYGSYARSVVACEGGEVVAARRVTFFGTRNGDDPATALSATQLVEPLAETIARENPAWSVQAFLGEAATKRRLLDLAGGPDTPALLFTGTHGIGFPGGHPLQLSDQGALVCQDWPGPSGKAVPVSPDQYLAGTDLGDDARMLGLIAFHFACFGAGTPQRDGFSHASPGEPPELAAHPFVAGLPKRALAHPKGGALAVVGHIDRAWGYSFSWPQAGRQTEVYRSCLARLLDGHPIGSAFEYFNERYAELSTELSGVLEEIEFGRVPDHLSVSALWTANNDARGFAIIGDPAVRLPLGHAPTGDTGTGSRVAAGHCRPELRSEETAPARQPAEGAEAALDVGDGPDTTLDAARDQLLVTLSGMAETLGAMLQRIVDEIPVLEVATYASDDPSAVRFDDESRTFTDADLRLLTRVTIDGSTSLVVGVPRGQDDEPLWNLHVRMVEQARAARTEFLREVTATVTSVVEALKGS
jgi:hypothetical protein